MPPKYPLTVASSQSREYDTVVNTGDLYSSLGFSLRRAQFSTYKDFGRLLLEPLEVRPSQFAVLVLIGANPGFSQSAISSTLGIQRANFVPLLDELESRGLIERRRSSKDRRSFALYLTKKGKAFTKHIQAAHTKLEGLLVKRLGERDSKLLLTLLNRFADAGESGA
jgi:DNA-binding MarR family transcriptional regulator